MKRSWSVLVSTLIISALLCACGTKHSGLVGKWESVDGSYFYWEFFSDGTVVGGDYSGEVDGNYTAENGHLRIRIDGGESRTLDYALHGNILRLSINGETVELRRAGTAAKQSDTQIDRDEPGGAGDPFEEETVTGRSCSVCGASFYGVHAREEYNDTGVCVECAEIVYR